MGFNEAVAAIGGAISAGIVGYQGFHMTPQWSVLLALTTGAALAGVTASLRARS